jgi:hypothetical protein
MGLTLVEVLMSTALSGLLLIGLAAFSLYASRVYAAMQNYSDMQSGSRATLDLMAQQIRCAKGVLSFSTNSVTVLDHNGIVLQFYFDPVQKQLIRLKNGNPRVLLSGCEQLRFDMFQRSPILGSFGAYPTTSTNECKMIQVTWLCTRAVAGAPHNSSSVQSAKIVIRKHADAS